MDKKTLSRFLIPVIVGALIWFSPIPNGVSPDAWHILAMIQQLLLASSLCLLTSAVLHSSV